MTAQLNPAATDFSHLMDNISIELITPEKAREYLAKSVTNRNLRMADVEGYALDMTMGDWEFNYDPLRFTRDGSLLDGQHRLHAIILTGISVPMMVVRGFEQSQQLTMDTGVPRKFHDILKIRGEISYFDLAALLRKIAVIEDRGSMWHGDSKTYKASNYRMLRLLDKDPNIRTIINKVARSREAGLPKSIAGACWYQFSKLDLFECAAFFDKLVSGASLETDDPIYILRKILMTNNSAHINRSSAIWKGAITIKAWNHFRDGDKIQSLTWRRGGVNPEKFPEPK